MIDARHGARRIGLPVACRDLVGDVQDRQARVRENPHRPSGRSRPACGTRPPVGGRGLAAPATGRPDHQDPVFGMLAQGSATGSASPAWSSSIEMPSGVFTKAMRPSRGGRLMTTPCFCSAAQVA